MPPRPPPPPRPNTSIGRRGSLCEVSLAPAVLSAIMLRVLLSAAMTLALAAAASVSPLPAQLKGALPAVCGPVANGYGRGSRKLGIPTANLPCSLFQEQLAELPCGVYVAWAGVRGEIHKCVCNIGFSPTFAGAENPEKIVEAHIMESFENDFYGEPMRLLLLGFIREERKFSGIDELLATIKADIETARSALDEASFASLAGAPWLRSGGDEAGSLELFAADDLRPSSAATGAEMDGPPPPPGFTWGEVY